MDEEHGRNKNICRNCHINPGERVANCQDLLVIILLRLPARTLISFKLVSKQFYNVISAPLFRIEHVRLHHKNRASLTPTGIYFYSSFINSPTIYSVSLTNPARSLPSLSFLEVFALRTRSRFKIVQACNGLLLCSFNVVYSLGSYSSGSSRARFYFVYNPTTRGKRTLPRLPTAESSSRTNEERERRQYVLALAFNPLRTHVYKVFGVRVVKEVMTKFYCELIVYSSDEAGRGWRKVGNQFKIPEKLKRICHGVFHDGGKITWICERGFIHFDVHAEEVVEVTRCPKGSTHWQSIRFFGESIDDGKLHVVKLKYHLVGVDVFQWKPETLNWETIRVRPIRPIIDRLLNFTDSDYRNCEKRDKYQILAIGSRLVIAIPGMVFCCSPVLRESQVLRQMPEEFREDFSFDCVSSFQFVETLSPV